MKILYAADDRLDAQRAAVAVRGRARDAKLIWAGRLSDAARWLSDNRDVTAIVVEAAVQNESCAALVRHARELAITGSIIVVVPQKAVVPAAVFEAGVDEFVVRNESVFSKVAEIVGAALRCEQTEQRLDALTVENGRLRESEGRLQATLAAANESRVALDAQLNEAAQARHRVDARLAAALTLLQHRDADADAMAARLRTFEAELAAAREMKRTLELRRTELDEAFDEVVRRSAEERLAAAQRAAAQQSEFEAALAEQAARVTERDRDLAATREEFAQRLEERDAAFRSAEERHASEMRAESAAYAALERSILTLEQQRAAAERQHAEAMEAADGRLAEQRQQYEARLADAAAAHLVSDNERRELDAALARERDERAAEAAAAAARAALLESELAESHRTIEDRESARRQADDRHACELEAAARARGELETRIAALEQQLRDADATLVAVRSQSEWNAAAAAERLTRRESELTAASAARLALEQRLVEVEDTLAEVRERSLAERAAAVRQAARRQAEHEAQLAREAEARGEVERAIERRTCEHSAELLRVEALVAERDERLAEAASSERELRELVAARNQQVDQLNAELQALTRDLSTTKNQRDALQLEAHRAPELARQLAASRAQSRRQFEQSPASILRCTQEGALQDANHALTSALGYRSVDELRGLDFPDAVFASADEFRRLVQRCHNRSRQFADCILKKKDGTRLSMRLHAAQVSADTIEIVAEDLTNLRAVEERLRQAHRIEAVGRVASEVADTCDNLLRNVSRSGRQWMASLGDTAPRQEGELIFADVARAAGFLRQLSAYGHKQARAHSPVDVNKVLRDLEPVLKRVAGDDIELALPKKQAPLYVDVDAERVERVFVNVAAYGRARMPAGGRLVVELARVAVDSTFVTKHPNVREGGHALIRITEVKAARPQWPMGLHDVRPAAESETIAERPGVDLGALQMLIADCGGHLWINAEPGGDMEVKIRLPLRASDQTAAMAGARVGRAVTRWFQS